MRGQVGYWGSNRSGGMAVGFGNEMLDWLERQACDRRVFVSVNTERKVIVFSDKDGGHVSRAGPSNACLYRYVSSTVPDSLFLDLELPPFELLTVDFVEENGCLSTELPNEDYRLPWPRLQADCTTYEAEQLARDALQVRLNALIASGMSSFPPGCQMPHRLARLLPQGTYGECIRIAKSLSGGSYSD